MIMDKKIIKVHFWFYDLFAISSLLFLTQKPSWITFQYLILVRQKKHFGPELLKWLVIEAELHSPITSLLK